MPEQAAFDMLHEGVRRQLWKMGWPELRQLQVDAIRHILSSDGHVVLSASTASGKTEAAFLPVLSAIADEPADSVRAIYVGPLKALINDQFARVEELCGYLDLPVHRWHGDVGATAKSKLVAEPGGVLLVTPESLESLFVNRSNSLHKLFKGLRFVVIDELHSFLDNERGRHLRSLLYRLSALNDKPLRLIGLSATIGEPEIAKQFLDRDRPENVHLIKGVAAETELKLRLHAYVAGEIEADNNTPDEDHPPSHAREMSVDLLLHCTGHTNLIFANARNDVEYFGELCGRMAAAKGLADHIMVHHGSLSADLRQQTEETMKDSSRRGPPATTFCSSTLEMGIDIGNVHMVGQIGAPHSVAALKQRVGRSGRRKDAPRILRMYLRCDRVHQESDLFDRLHLHLIQTIAVTELLLQGWVEPAEPTTFDLSTLTQQIISLVAETGGVHAKEAHRRLCAEGFFRDVEPSTFAALLRELASHDVLEQTPKGELILGLVGEDIRKDKGFYAAFIGGEAFTVSHDGQKIGTVDDAPEVGQHMVLARRRWRVVDVDTRQRTIYVVPASGSKGAPFAGSGKAILHPRVVAEMRKVLESSQVYGYLTPLAAQLLADARHTASSVDLCRRRFISLDTNTTALMTWCGSRTVDSLMAIFKTVKLDPVDQRVAIVLPVSVEKLATHLERLTATQPDESVIVEMLSGPAPAKYDQLVGEKLLSESKRRRWLDLATATTSVLQA